MDHYSQYKWKQAATESEHAIRKAEFDLVVKNLGDRIPDPVTGDIVVGLGEPPDGYVILSSDEAYDKSATVSLYDYWMATAPDYVIDNGDTWQIDTLAFYNLKRLFHGS